jgi:hypothetical protein
LSDRDPDRPRQRMENGLHPRDLGASMREHNRVLGYVGNTAAREGVGARNMTSIIVTFGILLTALLPVGLLVFAVRQFDRGNPSVWIPLYILASLVGAVLFAVAMRLVLPLQGWLSACLKVQARLISTICGSKTAERLGDLPAEITFICLMLSVGPCILFFWRQIRTLLEQRAGSKRHWRS